MYYYRIGNFIKQTISYIDVLDLLILVEFAKPDYPRELTYIVNQRMHSEIYDIFFHKDLLYYIFLEPNPRVPMDIFEIFQNLRIRI